MEVPPPFQQLPADPKFIDQIVNQIKSQGTFDQWRRECLADVDTKPAYQNLTFRVDSAVAGFLGKQRWRPDMVKNQVRENLRKHIHELGLVDKGVDRIVEQVVQPKVLPVFHPAVEDAIYNFLGIKNPRTETSKQQAPEMTSTGISPRKTFRPMPVSVPSRDKEDGTPPPGEEFDLEAITPSSESRCGSSMKKDLPDDVSDVSMDESRPPPEAGLERICSPISPQSSSVEDTEATERNRVGSALSAISSNDDIPSASPAAASPVTPEEIQENKNPSNEQPEGSPASSDDEEEDDEEDDFSSPEFEKLDINAPSSRNVTPVPGEEDLSRDGDNQETNVTVADDHYRWRPKIDGRGPDRKPDEDPGDLGSKRTSETAIQASRNQSSESGNQPSADATSESGKSTSVTTTTAAKDSVDTEAAESDKIKKEKERSISSSSKDRSRSKSESHKSDRRDKSRKDKERDKDRDRQKDRERDKDRERRREREKREDSERRSKSHHSKSSHRDRDEKKKSSHRDKDRDRYKDRDRNRSRSNHETERNRSNSHKDKEPKSSGSGEPTEKKSETSVSPLPTLHPKAYLWKRPAEKPTALWQYLARFPDQVFDETCHVDIGLSDVSVSSVSSYEDSDAESTILLVLSEVEVDSEIEEVVVQSGGRVIYPNLDTNQAKHDGDDALESDYTPASDDFSRSESCLRDQQLNINNNKRVRKLNTRYSDSYVGSELRKIITTQQHAADHSQRSPRLNINSKSIQARENQENCMQDSSPEETQEREEVVDYPPPDTKRLKTDQPLPSSPESVQSDLTHLPHVPANTPPPPGVQSPSEEDASKDTSPNGRRRSAA